MILKLNFSSILTRKCEDSDYYSWTTLQKVGLGETLHKGSTVESSQVWMVGGSPARSGWWGYHDQVWIGGYPGQVWMVGGVPRLGLDGGGGVPWLGLDGGGYPSQVWMVGWVPWPGLDGGGGYPGQVWMVEGYPGYPPDQVWIVRGTLQARSGWWGYPGQVWIGGGVTLARSGW